METAIRAALVSNGGLTTHFIGYEDIITYQSGIYQHVTGKALGSHAVELVGYGEENGVRYWKVKNSWGPDWGESGYFRMIRGQDECGIEENVYASKM